MGLRRQLSRLPFVRALRRRWLAWRYDRELEDIYWLLEECDGERSDFSLPVRSRSRIDLHMDRYRMATGYVAGSEVADIACGTGYGSHLLYVEGGAKRLVGIDIEQRCIDYADRYHRCGNMRFIAADGCDTGLPDEAFDVVVSFETIEHVEDPDRLVAEFERILRPGGQLLISSPNDWGVGKHHLHSWDYQQFAAIVGERFHVEQSYSQYTERARQRHNKGGRIIERCDADDRENAQIFILRARRES